MGPYSGAIVHGDYFNKPSDQGVLICFDAGKDLEGILTRVEPAGGKIVTGKTELPGLGYYARFIDSEGNKIGLMEIKS